MMDRETLLNLIPAYTLGALDPDERAAVETWVASDPEAQTLLAEYQAVTEQLSLAAPLRQAPAHLEADFRRRLSASQPPAVVVRSMLPPDKPTAKRRDRSWLRYVLPLAAIVVFVLAGTIYVWQRVQDESLTDAELYAQIIAQEDSQRLRLVPGEDQEEVSGDLAVSASGTEAVICLWSLPELEPDQTFQLWLLDDEGTLRSGGLFQSNEPDDTYVRVPFDASISFYQAVGVSIEPAGGSPLKDQPTGPRVFRVQF